MKSTHLMRRIFGTTALRLALSLAFLVAVPAVSLAQGSVEAGSPVAERTTADGCSDVQTVALNDTLAQSVPQFTEAGWVRFTLQQNARYRLEVSNTAGLELALYDGCRTDAPAVKLHNGELEFTATRGGDLYLLVRRNGLASAGLNEYQVTLAPAAPHRASAAPLADVPEDILRRATNFLEELRGSDLAPEWRDARINPNARIFYRPDIQAAGYYEFSVERPVANGWEAAGYIELSSASHDYPVTSWNVTGVSPTAEMYEMAPLGVNLTEFYRLGMHNYAAEYEEPTALGISTVATDVVTLGDLPDKLALEGIPDKAQELLTDTIDDTGSLTTEGPDEFTLPEQTGWDSWATLKAQYAEDYDPLLRSLAQRTNAEWELNKNLQQYGESLVKGDERTVHGLASLTIASINVTGDGADAQFLKQEQLGEAAAPTGIRLTVLDEPADKDLTLPFTVTLTYTDDKTEVLKYRIVNHEALSSGKVFLPFVANKGQKQQVSAASIEAARAPDGDWGPWSYWWVGGNPGGIVYNQFPAGSSPNTSACWSGCGATAWAMVFGWFDRNKSWDWWLYRQNGGFGTNVVAPLVMDTGVRNMTWEIRNYMGTFCSGSGGATYYTRMIDAYKYVQPRAASGWQMKTRYDPTGLCWFGACNGARDLARNAILGGIPAILGENNHYPMAYGFAQQSRQSCFLWWCSTDYNRWFWVNQGWGGSGNAWINNGDVKFAGTFQ